MRPGVAPRNWLGVADDGAASGPQERTRVAHLTARLRVERRDVEKHHGAVSCAEDLDIAVKADAEHGRLRFKEVVTDEPGRRQRIRPGEPDSARRRLTTLTLFLHGRLEPLEVDRCAALCSHLNG